METAPSIHLHPEQTVAAQDRQVMRDPWLGRVHRAADLPHRAVLVPQIAQDAQPERIAGRGQQCRQRLLAGRTSRIYILVCPGISIRSRIDHGHDLFDWICSLHCLPEDSARTWSSPTETVKDPRHTMRPTLHDLHPRELQDLLRDLDEPSWRGQQLAEGLYRQGRRDLEEITTLPRKLRQHLRERHGLTRMVEVGRRPAPDGTVKHLFELGDGCRIESVAIAMEKGRRTFCLSSQVGCRMACTFCATARMGLVRQLTPGEIVSQVLALRRRYPGRRQVNLVFMGMGEPLDNFLHLAKALAILSDPLGLDIGARHITISTSGSVDGIRRLAGLGRPYGLAVSLTTARPADRRRLMPVAAATPVEELIAAAAEYGRTTRRTVTLECALIAGENDDEASAKELIRIASSGPFKVNLIPLNPIDGYPGRRPDPATISRFADRLWRAGVVCTVRNSSGREVGAACGQLAQRRRRGN